MTYDSEFITDLDGCEVLDGFSDADLSPSLGFSKEKYVREIRADLARLNPLNDDDFKLALDLVLNPLVGVKIDFWSNVLCVSPLTIQRWRKGIHLPYPIPRKGFVAELLAELDSMLAR